MSKALKLKICSKTFFGNLTDANLAWTIINGVE